MELQPHLFGKLLKTRPLAIEDFELLHAAANDPLIWEQHPDPLRYQRDTFQRYFDSGIASKGCLVIEDIDTCEVIGSSRFYDYSQDKKEITVGFTFLKRNYWGGEFNRELKHLMLNHAFTFVDTVLFDVGSENHRSRRALEKIGAVLISEDEKADRRGNKIVAMTYSLKKKTSKLVINHFFCSLKIQNS